MVIHPSLRCAILLSMSLIPIAALAFQGSSNRSLFNTSEALQAPIGIDQRAWREKIPANNPITAAKVALGKQLYFDKRLSIDGTISCATCHDPANAFTDHTNLAVGILGRPGTRNAPTILNVVFNERFFWDGRAASLEEQAKQPLTSKFEMGMGSYKAVVNRLQGISQYRTDFQRVFPNEGITIDTIAKAIASFERTKLSGNSPFDRFIAGDSRALTETLTRSRHPSSLT